MVKDELRGELELTAEKIKTTFDKRKKVGENLQELENYFKDLGFRLNCTLANEAIEKLKDFLGGISEKKFMEIQHIFLDMQKQDNGYLKKLTNPNNPYGIKYSSGEESEFLTKLYEYAEPKMTLDKFMIYFFSRKGWRNFIDGE